MSNLIYPGHGEEKIVGIENVILFIFLVFAVLFIMSFLFCIRRPSDPRRGWNLFVLLAGNLALLFSVLFFILFGGELYFRFLYDQSDSFSLTRTGTEWFDKHFRLNSWGTRDSYDYPEAGTPGKTRITFLGDSFTAGHGVADVEKRFANRIRALRPGWEVHAFGFIGYDSIDELGFLTGRALSHYHYDSVVLVYTLNDISKIMPQWYQMMEGIYSEKPPYLCTKSYFLNTLYFRWKRRHIPDVLNFYRSTLSAYKDPAIWKFQRNILQRVKGEVEAHGGKLLVVTFPFLNSLGKDYEFREVHKQLAGFWREQGVPQLDLLETLESHRSENLTVNPYDAHPNERAHALASEAIMTFLDANIRPNINVKE